MNCEVLSVGDYSELESAGSASPDGGLGYSRHYAQRIRDLGQTSKDSWIKRLWNHMFGSGAVNGRKIIVKSDDDCDIGSGNGNGNGNGSSGSDGRSGGTTTKRATIDHAEDRSLPPPDISSHYHSTESSNHTKKPPHHVPTSEKHVEVVLPVAPRQTRSMHDLAVHRTMPPQLANSPYLPSREKVVYYRPSLTSKAGGLNPRDGVVAAKLRYQRLSKSTTTLRGPSHHSAADTNDDVQRKSTTLTSCPVKRQSQFKRDSAVIQMEKRAKAVADRAIMVRTVNFSGCKLTGIEPLMENFQLPCILHFQTPCP